MAKAEDIPSQLQKLMSELIRLFFSSVRENAPVDSLLRTCLLPKYFAKYK